MAGTRTVGGSSPGAARIKIRTAVWALTPTLLRSNTTCTSDSYLGHVQVGLFQELPDDENVGGGAVARDVILGRGYLGDQGRGGVLNLL